MKKDLFTLKVVSLFFVLCQLVFFILPLPVAAQDTPVVKVHLGSFTGSEFTTQPCNEGKCPVDWIGQYISALYQYGIIAAAILATVMIMIGGFLWLTSGGSPNRISRGKEFIMSSISGLLLALFSFIMLFSINPALINLKSVDISQPGALATPEQTSGSGVDPSSAAGKFLSELDANSNDFTPYSFNYRVLNYKPNGDGFYLELSGSEGLARFLFAEGTGVELTDQDRAGGAVARVVYNDALWTLRGSEVGNRYWEVLRLPSDIGGVRFGEL
ncbi:MAG: pilin [Patescibacteria group bacterium]|nr:pilin [Patescibacteria group bacterium]